MYLATDIKTVKKVHLRLHLRLHLLVHSLMCKSAQNNSSNGEPDAALEGTLYDRVNVALESAP